VTLIDLQNCTETLFTVLDLPENNVEKGRERGGGELLYSASLELIISNCNTLTFIQIYYFFLKD